MAAANNSSGPKDNFNVATVSYMTGEAVIAILTAFGNGLVMAAIIKHHRLQTITNYFVASLAAADFLVGVLGIPCSLVAFAGLEQNHAGCVLVNLTIVILTQISVLGLCAVAVERFVAIRYPYKYAERCTGRLCAVVIAAVWLAGIAMAVVPVMVWDKSSTYDGRCSFGAVIDQRDVVYVNFYVCTLVPLAFVFAIYCYVFYVIRRHVRRIAAVHQMAAGANQNVALRKESKAAKWFAVVILLFAISWLPLHVMNTVLLYDGAFCLPCVLVAVILSHANSAVNPVLYAYANSKFKTAFKQMLRIKDGDFDESATQDTRND